MACAGCGGWEELQALVTSSCGPYTPTEGQTTRGGAGGTYHGCASAEDFGCANYDCACAFAVLEPFARAGQLAELCGGTGAHSGCIDDGKDVPMWSGHLNNHTHAGCPRGLSGGITQVGIPGVTEGLCFPGTDICLPGVSDLAGLVKELLTALVMALTGGRSLAEVGIRAVEIWAGAILMVAGLIMFTRLVSSRSSTAQGLRRAARPVKRGARKVQRAARRDVDSAAPDTSTPNPSQDAVEAEASREAATVRRVVA